MNPLKCAFGVTQGKFLDFIVRHRGIEIDQAKVRAIQDMPPLRNLKELLISENHACVFFIILGLKVEINLHLFAFYP